MGRLRRVREQQGDRDLLVTIALDGENAWEFYPRDGHDFLNALYGELEADEGIIPTTVSNFLAQHPSRQPMARLHTGSWIGASLDTWIGDPEHNVAWDLLAETRDWLEDRSRGGTADPQALAAAWREILITEGSDWFWWFSRRHDSGMDTIWDNQFRLHLRNVYKLLGVKPPARLFQPIIQRTVSAEKRQPLRDLSPAGLDDPAWDDAGYFQVASGFGALHRPGGMVDRLLYAADPDHLYLRIDSPLSAAQLASQKAAFLIYCSGPLASLRGDGAGNGTGSEPGAPAEQPVESELGFEPASIIEVVPRDEGAQLAVRPAAASEPSYERSLASPFMVTVPFGALGKRGGEPMELAVVVTRDGRDVEQVPPVGSLGLRVPRRELEPGESRPLKVLVASAEVAPFAKLGGIADVVASLPKELRRLGHDARIVMPRYRGVSVERFELRPILEGLRVPLGTQFLECSILEGRHGDVPVYFIDCPQLYDRDAIYGFGDDDARFIYLSRALLEMLQPLGFVPDVIHLHDWHTALVPNLLDRLYTHDPALSAVATVLTIHNLPFQGSFGSGALNLANLERWGLMRAGVPHLDEVVNILARGIHFCDVFNTVSEQYAKEIQTPELGEGMDALIRAYAHKLYGIVNGIDYDSFDPGRDPALPHHFSAGDLGGKRLNKSGLRAELGLAENETPLVAFISRFYEQKGLDLLERAMPGLMGLDLQLVVLGTGERRYEDMFRYHAAQHPGRMAAYIGFDQRLAQLLYAGADIFLMPSRFEPCGLGQLISLRYGTIPVVRATGGLVDTIKDFDPAAGSGFGFVFKAYDAWQMFAAVVRATETYRHPEAWSGLIGRAMAEDVSWARSARRYVQLYQAAMAGHADRHRVAAHAQLSTTSA
jgi:starch synthase